MISQKVLPDAVGVPAQHSAPLLQVAVPAAKRVPMTTHFYVTHFMPTGFFMALSFVTGNTGYLYLTVRRPPCTPQPPAVLLWPMGCYWWTAGSLGSLRRQLDLLLPAAPSRPALPLPLRFAPRCTPLPSAGGVRADAQGVLPRRHHASALLGV